MDWTWSRLIWVPKSKHVIQGLPNDGLKLNKRRPKHGMQGLFTKVSATLHRNLADQGTGSITIILRCEDFLPDPDALSANHHHGASTMILRFSSATVKSQQKQNKTKHDLLCDGLLKFGNPQEPRGGRGLLPGEHCPRRGGGCRRREMKGRGLKRWEEASLRSKILWCVVCSVAQLAGRWLPASFGKCEADGRDRIFLQ